MSKITQEELFQYLAKHPSDDVDMDGLMKFTNTKTDKDCKKLK